MSLEEHAQRWREQYSDKSDDELILLAELETPHPGTQLAAKQILHKRQLEREKEAEQLAKTRHVQSLEQERLLHHKTQRVAWSAFWAAVVGVIIAGVGLIHDLCRASR